MHGISLVPHAISVVLVVPGGAPATRLVLRAGGGDLPRRLQLVQGERGLQRSGNELRPAAADERARLAVRGPTGRAGEARRAPGRHRRAHERATERPAAQGEVRFGDGEMRPVVELPMSFSQLWTRTWRVSASDRKSSPGNSWRRSWMGIATTTTWSGGTRGTLLTGRGTKGSW